MRTGRIVGVFVALAVALGLATVPATAQAAATLPSQLSIKAAKAVYYGKTFTVAGRFTTKVGNTTYYVDDVDVELWSKPHGASAFKLATTQTTASGSGNYSFSVKASKSTQFQIRYAGDDDLLPGTSSTKTVKVRRDIIENSKKLSGRNFKFFGKVAPSYGKKPITLQKKVGSKWKKVTTKKTSPAGKWSFTVQALKHRGKIKFRTTVPSKGGYLGDTSRVLVITTY